MPVRDKDQASFINPEYFREGFSVDAFLVKLTQDVIDNRQQALTAGGRPISNEEAARATIDRVKRLIKRFIQAEYEISALGHDVAAKLGQLQQTANVDETQYKAEVRTLELVSERIKDGIRDIDARVSRISQTATRVGDRLQTADGLRLRCLEAQELIGHLQAFSCHTAGEDFSKLPHIFTNEATLAEAAAVSRRLVQLAGDVAAAQQRSKITSSGEIQRTAINKGGVGSVEHTMKVLESYCNWLENRVVTRFDNAVANGDMKMQARGVAIMIELDKERSIAQRWVASRPCFLAFSPEMLDTWVKRASRLPSLHRRRTSSKPSSMTASAVTSPRDSTTGEVGAGGTVAESGTTLSRSGSTAGRTSAAGRISAQDIAVGEYDIVYRQSKALALLYKEMHASVQDDVAEARAVFTKPEMVIEMFMQRLFEQNVQAALERLLLPTSTGMQALAATVAAGAAAAAAGGAGRQAEHTGGLGGLKNKASNMAAAASHAMGAGASSAGSAGAGSSGAAASDPSTAALLRLQLRLLAEAYGKTQLFAVNLEKAVKAVAPIDVQSMAEGLWPAFVGNYPAQELNWLQAAYQEEVALQDTPELSLDFCYKLMLWNAEATERAMKLSAPAQAARNCRMLFHYLVVVPAAPAAGSASAGPTGGSGTGDSSTGGAAGPTGGSASGPAAAAAAVPAAPTAHPGCLLEHLARHIIGGMEYSLELCSLGGAGGLSSIFKLGFGTVSKASSIQMAGEFVNAKIRKALEAANVATEVMAALQAHYTHVVAPAVRSSVAELSAASSALLALIRAAEDSITAVLRKSIDTFVTQMERVLANEQRRSDFVPRDNALSFDKPTSACLLGTALLAALGEAVASTLEGQNKNNFLTEVSRRSYLVLLAHMQKFTYSPTGALKWKKDVNEYAEVLASYSVPSANEDMAHLQQLVNVLVVAPDSLLGLVNGSLRMSHKDALRFVALREDFKTARVDGKTLQQLFSGEGMESQLGQR